MNQNKSISAALALATSLLLSTSASAKEHKPKASDNQMRVVAHITFAGQTPLNMTMQKQGDDKYYLYIYIQRNNESISVVDVVKPSRPKTVGEVADPSLTNAVNVSDNLAVVVQTEMAAMSNFVAKADLVFWDISNPAAPRAVQKFSNVVKWLQDERNFIYVLNNEGLWIISQPENWQPDPTEIPLYE